MPGLEDLGNFNTASFNLSAIYSGAIAVARILVILAIVAGLAWWYMKRGRFKMKAVVIGEIANKNQYVLDNCGIFTENGIKRLKTLRTKADLPPPDNQYMGMVNGKPAVFIKKLGHDNFTYLNPNTIITEGENIVPVDWEAQAWAVMKTKENQMKLQKQSFFEKYGPQITQIISLVLFIVAIWVALDYISGMVQQTGSSITNAASQIADSLANICGVEQTPVPSSIPEDTGGLFNNPFDE